MQPATQASTSNLQQRIKALVPMIEARAEQVEAQRKPDDDVIAALADTGLFRAFVPAAFGGDEIDTDTFINLGLLVSRACTSTGWVSTFYMEHNWMLAHFPRSTQRDVFGGRGYLLAPATISPGGHAVACDGGYRISGQWSWGTGIMHADYAILNAVVEGEEDGPRLFLLPRAQVQVLDTWYAAGMAGTGSNDIRAEDVFVPSDYTCPLKDMAIGRGAGLPDKGAARYRHPMMPLLCIAAAIPALGAAQRALALFRARLEGRKLYGMSGKQVDRPSAQILFGDAHARVRAAELTLRDVGRRLSDWGERADICPMEDRAEMRLSAALAVRECRDTVRRLMDASGASAHLSAHPMQRIARDINTLSCHTVFDADIGAENYGRLLLGLKPASPV
ncbi:acyl-CoA dehydrogenase family protein [Parahaliea mediterranea]|uniref:acyl-CoA dehydrogenase family protein n=1 Tax=Parahaliea mediterranea TaxID=651086 RepID=UPI000E2FEEAC|nr:acyl-CoA dehydrogenase family protein [Parahaliea mediterranea]